VKRCSYALSLALVVASSSASAQTLELFGPDRGRAQYESDQSFALELRFSPWQPDVDSEFGNVPGGGPFLRYFGEASCGTDGRLRVCDRVLPALEFDWQALRIHPIGTLGLGVSLGYSSLSANAPLTSSPGVSEQSSSLNVLPAYAVGVLRLDVLARRTVIPLVFYGKAGVAGTYWWITSGDQLARRNAQSPTRSGEIIMGTEGAATGFSYAWQLAAGVMFRLDWLEPQAQRSWDVSMGVNHSYLFAEYMLVRDWDRAQLRLGSNTWTFGAAFEF
jgi:hypothetical protein